MNSVRIILAAILTLALALLLDYAKQDYDLSKDALKMQSDAILQNTTGDYNKAFALMNWVHNNSEGVCYQKSSLFEALARSQGLQARHIVFRKADGVSSHASSQVFVNGSWTFFDSYFGGVKDQEWYLNQGYASAWIHYNCEDGTCSNIDFPTKIINQYTRVKPLWLSN